MVNRVPWEVPKSSRSRPTAKCLPIENPEQMPKSMKDEQKSSTNAKEHERRAEKLDKCQRA